MRNDREKLTDVCLDCQDNLKKVNVDCDKECPVKRLLDKVKDMKKITISASKRKEV